MKSKQMINEDIKDNDLYKSIQEKVFNLLQEYDYCEKEGNYVAIDLDCDLYSYENEPEYINACQWYTREGCNTDYIGEFKPKLTKEEKDFIADYSYMLIWQLGKKDLTK